MGVFYYFSGDLKAGRTSFPNYRHYTIFWGEFEEKYLTSLLFVRIFPCTMYEEYAMRLNLREIIHIARRQPPFQFQLDLSGGGFSGSIPSPAGDGDRTRKKRGGCAGPGRGEARSVLDETCDRCMTRFSREKVVPPPVPAGGKPNWRTRRRTTLSSWKTARWTWASWLTPPSS